jgi:hypothetical protein
LSSPGRPLGNNGNINSESLTLIKCVTSPHDISCQRLSHEWFITSGAAHMAYHSDISYEQYLTMNDIHEYDHQLMADLNQLSLDLDGRTNMASFIVPSIHSFMTRVNDTQMSVSCTHMRILTAFIRRHRHIGYVQGLNLLTAFLSCVADEVTTFWLLCALVAGRTRDFYSRAPVGMRGFTALCTLTTKLVTQVLTIPFFLDLFI